MLYKYTSYKASSEIYIYWDLLNSSMNLPRFKKSHETQLPLTEAHYKSLWTNWRNIIINVFIQPTLCPSLPITPQNPTPSFFFPSRSPSRTVCTTKQILAGTCQRRETQWGCKRGGGGSVFMLLSFFPPVSDKKWSYWWGGGWGQDNPIHLLSVISISSDDSMR